VRHIRLVVEYDGSQLHGWQRQHNAPTVQQHLEEALAKLLTHETQIAGASRTDAGVHARGQVASFRTERAIGLHGIRRGLNALLPDAIAIASATEAAEDFHPRFSATGKHYRYLLFTRAERSPRAPCSGPDGRELFDGGGGAGRVAGKAENAGLPAPDRCQGGWQSMAVRQRRGVSAISATPLPLRGFFSTSRSHDRRIP
jgi:tRNA U38,U39,U40 pseudouridine synthase TruA